MPNEYLRSHKRKASRHLSRTRFIVDDFICETNTG